MSPGTPRRVRRRQPALGQPYRSRRRARRRIRSARTRCTVTVTPRWRRACAPTPALAAGVLHQPRPAADGDGLADLRRAEPDDLVAAYEDRLYVAGDDGRLLAYDLGSLAEPTVLYTAPDDKHRPKGLVPCGEHRACLLEVTDGDATTAAVLVATEGKGSERWPAPGTDVLVPLGERVLARRTYPEPASTLFGPDGERVLDERNGVAVRVDAGNLLVFAEPLTSGEDDRSVAGVGAESGRVAELGQLMDVRGESCSWNTDVIACGSAKDFVLQRFAPAD